MKVSDYVEIIQKTAVYPKQVNNFGVAYCYMGLEDELNEVIDKSQTGGTEKEVEDEIGDCLWYVCALCNELNIPFDTVLKNRTANPTNYKVEMPGIFKKFYRDNKPINTEVVSRELTYIVYQLCEHLSEDKILEILENNYNKLMKRRETNTLHGDGDYRHNT